LPVSHWTVSSESTVKLITKAVAELKADPQIGRAEALRRSMLSIIDAGKNYEAHPAFWAPFVLVGEGGAARWACQEEGLDRIRHYSLLASATRAESIAIDWWRCAGHPISVAGRQPICVRLQAN
jgi:hypothetical protein